jgi:threonine dehydrogenase-like Zn-dependent dehydrogenase
MGMKVAIIGSGYVGISTGVSLALIGHQVRLLDVNEAKIERLKKLEAPFFEPGLETALRCAAPNLEFTSDYALALAGVDVAIIAVGTPSPGGQIHRAGRYEPPNARGVANPCARNADRAGQQSRILTPRSRPVGHALPGKNRARWG